MDNERTLEEALGDEPVENVEKTEKAENIEETEAVEPKMVPLGVLTEERAARQAAQRDAEEARQKYETVSARVDEINDRLNPAPDAEEDPFGALQHGQEETNKSVKEIRETLEKSQSQTEAQALQGQIQNLENQFAQKQTDYWQAMEFLKDKLTTQYTHFGLSEPEAQAKFQQDTGLAVQAALRAGKNPSEVAYSWAKEVGYAASNGKATGQTAPQQSLNQVAEGLKNEGLSGTGGQAKGELTPESLADMSAEEYNEWLDKAGDKGFKKVMGG